MQIPSGADEIGHGGPHDEPIDGLGNKNSSFDILIVDDDALLRRLLQTSLEKAGYTATAVSNGTEAIRFLECQSVRLVITDVFMPDGDGLELLRMLQQTRAGLSVIVMSGSEAYDRDLFLRIARHFGATRTVVKPFGFDEILTAVRTEIGEPSRS